MYHIPNDERAKKSAETIYQSLRHILFHKKLDEVKITDIQKECGISRSTFYRLFDNVTDVLSMKLAFFVNLYFDSYLKKDDEFIYFFNFWDKHSDLIYLLSKQAEFILKDTFKSRLSTTSIYNVYFIEAQVSFFTSLLCKWVERKKQESPLQMSLIAKKILNNPNYLLILP